MDNVILSFNEVVETFGLKPGTLRMWINEGRIEPVRREGRGRDGAMWFARGEVSNLVHGSCPVCGNGFKKGTLRQRFCSTLCRQRAARMKH